MTIRLEIHPLAGEELQVLRQLRTDEGVFLEVLHPDGWPLQVPVWWTVNAHDNRSCQATRATGHALMRLSEATETLRSFSMKTLDTATSPSNQRCEDDDEDEPDQPGHHAEAHSGVGHLGAPGDCRRGDRES